MSNIIHPGAGLGVFVTVDSRLLVGKRKKDPGRGMLQLAGGHLEALDPTIQERAVLEVRQETGLEVMVIPRDQYQVPMWVSYHHFEGDPRPFLHLWVLTAMLWDGRPPVPENREPDKNEWWKWMTLEELGGRAEMAPARAALYRGEHHPQLDWMPLPAFYHFRGRLGL